MLRRRAGRVCLPACCPTVGTHHPDGPGATIVEIGGSDADGLARYLLSLGTPLRVLSPEDVRQALLRRIRHLSEDNEGGQPSQE
jgi:predicted DNA-binding transcriptional regulator YafY